MKRSVRFVPLMLLAASLVAAAPPAVPPIDFDRLDCRWTFGNHEPISMYRRAGNRVTGGMEGGALWLEDWHHWFDSEDCPRLMESLGLNMLHCRFYKGMGWQYESQDFPNVKRFVENCHKHNIRVLAYVQFSTLYYEIMSAEVPDLVDWAAVDSKGNNITYSAGAYYRWMPCINAPGFEPYLKKVIKIALEEGGFDGIMFDNCGAPACYCDRCADLFRKHLATIPNPEERFGIPTVDHVLPPVRSGFGEVQDPVYQEWIRFRTSRLSGLYHRLYQHAKACKPSAIVSGNVANIRRSNMASGTGLIPSDLADCFDIFVSQSGNAPGVVDGCVINRVREMKLADVLGVPILALCDSDAGGAREDQTKGEALALVEDAVFGGIPTDRTVLKADCEMVSPRRLAAHRRMLEQFNKTVDAGREGLAAASYEPVRILYSRESIMLSEQSGRAVLSAEEVLLRNHVPFGLLPASSNSPLAIPDDCEILLVCDQSCLSDRQLEDLAAYARGGGRVIVTGKSGEYNELYRQRRNNPLVEALNECPTARCRSQADAASIKGSGWTIKVAAPSDGGERLMKDLASLWTPPLRIQAPPTVLTEVRQQGGNVYVHLVNFAREPVAAGSRIELSKSAFPSVRCTLTTPLEKGAAQVAEVKGGTIELPAFSDYAVVTIETKGPSK